MATLTVTPIRTFTSGETVTPTKLNELSQPTVALTAATIVAADLASDAVTTAKILDANVTTAKIADAAVTAAKLDGAQTGSAPIYGCRAWVNFDGINGSTVDGEFRCTIRASGNVSKVVRNSTGNYTVTFTTAMPDANYCVSGACEISGQGPEVFAPITYAAGSVVVVSQAGATNTNAEIINVMVVR